MDCWSRAGSTSLLRTYWLECFWGCSYWFGWTHWHRDILHPSFCEDMCVPTRTYLTFNNDKPWFSTKLKQLRLAKEDAYRSGEKALYKQAKYTLNREIRVAKKNYAGKLKKQLSSNDPTPVWKGLKAITSYKTPPPSTEANQQLTEDLNSFYCWFQKQKPGLTPHTHSDHPTTQPSTPSPSPPTVSQPVIKICEEDVSKVFRRQKIRKAKGPDGVSPACLKACAVQLSSIFTLIFNRSLELCEVPSCFKRSTIIPVPKKPKITGLNDYRPVALTSVVMKSFEARVGSPEGHCWTPCSLLTEQTGLWMMQSTWDCTTSSNI